MSEFPYEDQGEALPQDPPGELVHWMEPKPMALGPGGVSAAVAGAFVAGVGVTLAVLALVHWLGPQRELVAPPGWRKRMLRSAPWR